jgi:hypothetical protein
VEGRIIGLKKARSLCAKRAFALRWPPGPGPDGAGGRFAASAGRMKRNKLFQFWPLSGAAACGAGAASASGK